MGDVRIPAARALLIAGPWGAARRRAICRLAALKPAGERWTVMANDLGEDMLDPGEFAPPGIAVRGAAYGCPCCLGNLPLRVKLGRLLRETAPDRLLLELPAGSHLDMVIPMFGDPLLAPVLTLDAVFYVLDPAAAADPLPLAVQAELGSASWILVQDAPAAVIGSLRARHPGATFISTPAELADRLAIARIARPGSPSPSGAGPI